MASRSSVGSVASGARVIVAQGGSSSLVLGDVGAAQTVCISDGTSSISFGGGRPRVSFRGEDVSYGGVRDVVGVVSIVVRKADGTTETVPYEDAEARLGRPVNLEFNARSFETLTVRTGTGAVHVLGPVRNGEIRTGAGAVTVESGSFERITSETGTVTVYGPCGDARVNVGVVNVMQKE